MPPRQSSRHRYQVAGCNPALTGAPLEAGRGDTMPEPEGAVRRSMRAEFRSPSGCSSEQTSTRSDSVGASTCRSALALAQPGRDAAGDSIFLSHDPRRRWRCPSSDPGRWSSAALPAVCGDYNAPQQVDPRRRRRPRESVVQRLECSDLPPTAPRPSVQQTELNWHVGARALLEVSGQIRASCSARQSRPRVITAQRACSGRARNSRAAGATTTAETVQPKRERPYEHA